MKYKKELMIQLTIFMIIFASVAVFASQAGGENDPVVTKSYVNDQINNVLKIINDTIGGTKDTPSTEETPDAEAPTTEVTAYIPVLVEVGQSIYGKEGTEMILRSGKGTAIVPGEEGIVNITKGIDIKNNGIINKNEMLIIPRDDSRGVKVTEKAWFLVKGEYEIK